MRTFWKIAGIAVLVTILGVVAVGVVATAQDSENGTDGPFDFAARLREAIASVLGITVEEYDAAVDKAQEQVVGEAVTEGWLTEDQAEVLRWRMDQAPGFGMRGMGGGFRGFGHGMAGWGNNLVSIAADKLDMSLTDLLTELKDGKSISDVANDKGVDPQTIVDAYLAQIKEDLDEAVAEGRITQKQADYHLQQMEQKVTDQLDNTWAGDGPGCGGPRGRMRGFPGMGGF